MTRGMVAAIAAFILGLTAPAQAGSVDLRISNGRVWLATLNATVHEILDEWTRVGRTEIVNSDRVPGRALSLRLDDVSEQEALEVLLREAGGFIGVRRAVSSADGSQFARLLIVPTRAPAAAGTVGAPVAPVVPPPDDPSVAMGGVARILGPDGEPVPDDQEDAPAPPALPTPRFRSLPPGFAPVESVPAPPEESTPAPRPPSNNRVPTMPPGTPTPGMIAPPPQPAPDTGR